MTATVFERLRARLDAAACVYQVLRHRPVFTSQEAAEVRGTALASGAKALVVKADDRFVMLVLPADRKLASKKLRVGLGVRSTRFATKEEVLELTGLEPGAIPPLGSLFNLKTYCDPKLAENETINFNAGDHSISVQMRYANYAAVEGPEVLECAE